MSRTDLKTKGVPEEKVPRPGLKELPERPHRKATLMNEIRHVSMLRAVKYYYLKLLRLRGNPVVLARGLAIGVFVGLTPTIPLHTILILILCTILRGNPIAGIFASLLVSNPLTIPLHYFAAWKIGVLLTGDPITWPEVKALLTQLESRGLVDGMAILFQYGGKVTGSVLLGGVVMALPVAVVSYFTYLRIYIARLRKKHRHILQVLEKEGGRSLPHE